MIRLQKSFPIRAPKAIGMKNRGAFTPRNYSIKKGINEKFSHFFQATTSNKKPQQNSPIVTSSLYTTITSYKLESFIPALTSMPAGRDNKLLTYY